MRTYGNTWLRQSEDDVRRGITSCFGWPTPRPRLSRKKNTKARIARKHSGIAHN